MNSNNKESKMQTVFLQVHSKIKLMKLLLYRDSRFAFLQVLQLQYEVHFWPILKQEHLFPLHPELQEQVDVNSSEEVNS